jgi:hypothetical protein
MEVGASITIQNENRIAAAPFASDPSPNSRLGSLPGVLLMAPVSRGRYPQISQIFTD